MTKWRQKERLKTTAVALVLCLNIGVDPPDVMKISPCARLECWVDPLSMQPPKALDTIGLPKHCHKINRIQAEKLDAVMQNFCEQCTGVHTRFWDIIRVCCSLSGASISFMLSSL